MENGRKLKLKRKGSIQPAAVLKRPKIEKSICQNETNEQQELVILSSDSSDSELQMNSSISKSRHFLATKEHGLNKLREIILKFSCKTDSTELSPFPAHEQQDAVSEMMVSGDKMVGVDKMANSTKQLYDGTGLKSNKTLSFFPKLHECNLKGIATVHCDTNTIHPEGKLLLSAPDNNLLEAKHTENKMNFHRHDDVKPDTGDDDEDNSMLIRDRNFNYYILQSQNSVLPTKVHTSTTKNVPPQVHTNTTKKVPPQVHTNTTKNIPPQVHTDTTKNVPRQVRTNTTKKVPPQVHTNTTKNIPSQVHTDTTKNVPPQGKLENTNIKHSVIDSKLSNNIGNSNSACNLAEKNTYPNQVGSEKSLGSNLKDPSLCNSQRKSHLDKIASEKYISDYHNVNQSVKEQQITSQVDSNKYCKDQIKQCGHLESKGIGISNKRLEVKMPVVEKVVLRSCPLCQIQFDPSYSQMDMDSHIAACLSAADDDVIW